MALAAQELNQQWVDAAETKIIEGQPDFSPYGEKESIWFLQDPYPGWRQHELSRICFQCGRRKASVIRTALILRFMQNVWPCEGGSNKDELVRPCLFFVSLKYPNLDDNRQEVPHD